MSVVNDISTDVVDNKRSDAVINDSWSEVEEEDFGVVMSDSTNAVDNKYSGLTTDETISNVDDDNCVVGIDKTKSLV